MGAYRSAPALEEKPPEDVRRLTIAPLGTFGIVVWDSFILVSGGVIAGALHYVEKDGLGIRAGATIGGITLGLALLVAVSVLLFETRLTLIARIEAGTFVLEERRGIGTKRVRSFAIRDLTGASVEEHGEDHVAAVLHTRKKQIPIFPTRIGDDARRVARFVADAVESWRAFTAGGPEEAPSVEVEPEN